MNDPSTRIHLISRTMLPAISSCTFYYISSISFSRFVFALCVQSAPLSSPRLRSHLALLRLYCPRTVCRPISSRVFSPLIASSQHKCLISIHIAASPIPSISLCLPSSFATIAMSLLSVQWLIPSIIRLNTPSQHAWLCRSSKPARFVPFSQSSPL